MRGVIVKKESSLDRLYMLAPILKAVLAVGLFFFILVVGFLYIAAHAKSTTATAKTQQRAIEDTLQAQVKSYLDLVQTEKQAEADAKRFQLLIEQFPQQSEVEGLLIDITKLGTAEGLRFVSFKPQKVISHDFYAEMPVEISVIGQYHQIAKFLSGIANLPSSVVAVNTFTLERQEKLPMLSLQFTATIYYATKPKAGVKP